MSEWDINDSLDTDWINSFLFRLSNIFNLFHNVKTEDHVNSALLINSQYPQLGQVLQVRLVQDGDVVSLEISGISKKEKNS